jgi:hypothetical protein
MPEGTACFICGEYQTLAISRTLSDGRRIGLCLNCIDSAEHVQTFTGAYLAERRANAMAEGFARWLTPGSDQGADSAARKNT